MHGNKKVIFSCVRILVSIILVGYIVYRVNWHEFLQILLSIKIHYLLFGMTLNVLVILLNSFRWKILLSVQMRNIKFTKLVNLWLIGLFFNNFLPTSLGGDSVKAYYVFRHSRKNPVAISSLIVLRSMGIVGLIVLVLSALTLGGGVLPLYLKNALLLFTVLLCLIVVLFLIGLWIVRKTNIPMTPSGRIGIWKWFEKIYGSLMLFRKHKRVLGISLILALLTSIMLVLVNSIYCMALDCHLHILIFFMLIPLINFVQMLPISMNGLGIREGAYVFFFGLVGMPSSDAFSLSMLILLGLIIFSIAGGVLYGYKRY